MLNCYCQLSSSVIFRQYGVSQSECKIDRPRPGLSRLSPRPHTKALGTRLGGILTRFAGWIRSKAATRRDIPLFYGLSTEIVFLFLCLSKSVLP
jgi:hypothetical protein